MRSWRERVVQTLSHELGALLIAAPLYLWLFGVSAGESLQLLATLSKAFCAESVEVPVAPRGTRYPAENLV